MKTDSIWKDNKTLPKDNTNVVVLGPMGYDGYRWLIEEHRDGYYQYENWKKWCYLDGLLEQSSKIERLENDNKRLKTILIGLVKPEIQDLDCSCHISPPCENCITKSNILNDFGLTLEDLK